VTISLPAEYTAFCLLHQNAYHRYAAQRLRDVAIARACVEGALGELVTIWPSVLSSARPSAVAWRVLRCWVNRAAGDNRTAPLPAPVADAVLLRDELHFPMAKIAAVMGLDEAAVTTHLRTAARTAAGTADPHHRVSVTTPNPDRNTFRETSGSP
jgi:hypothetical protein